LTLFNYWKKIFAIAFGMGVVSGIVMSYQFGTNWSVFSDKVGPVLGPLMGYEVMSAFFLEAGFLGVMLFGRERVGPKLHFFATLMVASGTAFSAFWILAVNSWMQTPAGFGYNEAGQFIVEDWFEVVFNPSFPYRLVHMVLAAYLTTAFVIAGVGAYHLLKQRLSNLSDAQSKLSSEAVRTMFSMAMWMAAIVTPLQMLAGDQHGLNTFKYQPRKIAAIEGHYETVSSAPLILFGIPDPEEQKMNYVVEVPYLGSLLLTHTLDGTIQGMKEWPKDEQPPMGIVFFAFRGMVGIGTLMLLMGFWSLWLRRKGKLYETPLMHRAAVVMGPSGFIAVLCGWVTTEVGRQPYTVYNLLTTADSISPISAASVGASLIGFIVVYFTLFGAGVFYIFRLMSHPPSDSQIDHPRDTLQRASGFVPPALLDAKLRKQP
jgi:cytochrome d ubiquinol oxidase subunit I